MVSFVSLAASVGLLIQDALTSKGPSAWTGTAGVLQCVFVLIRYFIIVDNHASSSFCINNNFLHVRQIIITKDISSVSL